MDLIILILMDSLFEEVNKYIFDGYQFVFLTNMEGEQIIYDSKDKKVLQNIPLKLKVI